MSDWSFVVADPNTGLNLGELPLYDVTFSYALSDVGAFSGSLSPWHWAATESMLGLPREASDRELTVFRNDIPVWNGPITGVEERRADESISISAREPSWYLQKRVLEEDKEYTAQDVFSIVRDLKSYMEAKTANGDDGMTLGDSINAALPRFSVTAGAAGATADATFAGAARHTIRECFDFLAADPETGFDWRMDYTTGSTRQSCHRTLTLGYPALGVERTQLLTEKVLTDFGRTGEWERAANRVHVVGSGYTATLQAAGLVADGVMLTEEVEDLGDTADQGFVNARAREMRRLSRAPVKSFTATFSPSPLTLPFNFCDVGDTVPFEITRPAVMSLTASLRRVVQIDVIPDLGDTPELVTLTFNQPLDDLGT